MPRRSRNARRRLAADVLRGSFDFAVASVAATVVRDFCARFSVGDFGFAVALVVSTLACEFCAVAAVSTQALRNHASIRRRLLDVVDDEKIPGTFVRHELQPELLLDCGEDFGSGGIA